MAYVSVSFKTSGTCYIKQTMAFNGWHITPEERRRIVIYGSSVKISHTHDNYYDVSGISSIRVVGNNLILIGSSNAPKIARNVVPMARKPVVEKSPNKFYKLRVSLEDIFNGCTKSLPITRKVFSSDGTSKTENVMLPITIKPGCQNGTKYIFRNAGDRMLGRAPGDICCVVQEMPHPHFKREGSNILYIQTLTLKQALHGALVDIPTLDGKPQKLCIKPVVLPFTTRKLVGHGLPNPQMVNKRGDMILKFKIKLF